MTQIINWPLNTDFSDVYQLQAKGNIDSGSNLQYGIAGAIYIEDGVMVSTITNSDEPTATGIRAEIADQARAIGEYWYVWEFKLASDFLPTQDIMLMQIHDTPDDGDGLRSVPIALLYENDEFVVRVPLTTLPSESQNTVIIGRYPVIRDKWYRCCMRARWAIDSTGFREFYIDNIPIARQFNIPTMYDDVTGPYFKCGCYDSTHSADFGSVTAYYRNIAIWTGNDGYSTILGAPPSLQKQILHG